jgi:hypothetical protein
MSITLRPDLEARLRERAGAEGLTVEQYVESLARADQEAQEELEALLLEGLESGDPIEPGPGYWEERHRRLDEALKIIHRK